MSKRMNDSSAKIDKTKIYPANEAIKLAKETSNVKFDATVEVAFRLNVDPRHADQQIRGAMVLPKGSGKSRKVLVLTSTKEADAKAAGADFVGGIDMITKIQKENWFGFDIIVATPEMMPHLGKIGRILGPKGLMPNPKTGTVTPNVTGAIEDIKKGKIEYRVDKNGNLHVIIGKVSFTEADLAENFKAILDVVKKAKPAAVKGTYIKNITISTSMGPGIKVANEEN